MATSATYPEMMSRIEAAAYLGVKPQTLAKWACVGRYGVRFVRVGRLVKYRRADLDAWIAKRSEAPGEDSPADDS